MGVAIPTAQATRDSLLVSMGYWGALTLSTALAATAGATCAYVCVKLLGPRSPLE